MDEDKEWPKKKTVQEESNQTQRVLPSKIQVRLAPEATNLLHIFQNFLGGDPQTPPPPPMGLFGPHVIL